MGVAKREKWLAPPGEGGADCLEELAGSCALKVNRILAG